VSDQSTVNVASEAAPQNALPALRAELKGKVTRVELAGARVDIGTGNDALLHASEIMSDKPVTRVGDVLKAGDEITVYVTRVDAEKNRVLLTMHKPPTYGWDNLEPGTMLNNVKVVSITKFGVFVNIDGPKDALLPHEFVKSDNKLKANDVIETVWITEVSEAKNRIGLTMIEPPALPWGKIQKGAVLKGKVTRIERGNAFVDLGAEKEGRISSQGFGVGFTTSAEDFCSVGEEVEVRVSRVDSQRKIIDLSLMGIDAEDYAMSSGPEESMTPIEAALKRAQSKKGISSTTVAAATNGKQSKRQAAQAEAIARTLEILKQQKAAEQQQ